MGHINQKEYININFSKSLGIFYKHYGYPEIDHFNELSSNIVDGVKIDEQ